jgi:glutathione S-transferase
MADELVLYTHPMSRGRTARWMLEEIGQPYRAEVLGFGPPMKSADFLAINPMGKVPTLTHGDTVVTECAAICAYLADAFPQAGLAPAPGDQKRGAYYRWLFFGAGPIEAAVTNKALGVVVPDEKRGMAGYGSVEAVADALDGVLSKQDYLTGDTFTAADLYVGASLAWTMGFGVMEKRPSFERFVTRIHERPAASRAKEIDDQLVAEMKAAG